MILIVVAFLIVIGIVAYFSHLQQQQRRAELAAFAAENGWRFDPAKDRSFDNRYSQFSVFCQGHSRYAYNTIWGQLQVDDRLWPIRMGDYHYQVTSGSGKNRSTQTYRLSYVVVELPYRGLPSLTIRTEGFFDRLASFIGFDDIDFESAEFSDRFSVKSSDKRFAYDVIDPRMMEFLLRSDPPTISLENSDSCFCDGKRCWSSAKFRTTIDWIKQFYAHWPRHVVDSLEDRSAYGSSFQ